MAAETFSELFAARVARHPERVALIFGAARWSYRGLDRRAESLARCLRALAVAPEEPVGVCLEPGPGLILAFLALARIGAVYLPLDPGYPPPRLELMARESGMRRVILGPGTRPPAAGLEPISLDQAGERAGGRAEAPRAEASPAPTVAPLSVAYFLFTSGSTGRPKGVLIHHRGLCNLSRAQGALFGLGAEDRVLQFASASFDASIWELSMALLSGAALVLAERSTLAAPEDLAAWIDRYRVTAVTLPPSMLGVLSPRRATLRLVVAAGEACSASCVRDWSLGRAFVNAYGPTETTVCATASPPLGPDDLRPAGPRTTPVPPIGRAIPGLAAHLLDRGLRPVAGAGDGQIFVGGAGVGRGYHRRPAATAERFLPDPFAAEPGARLYATGDQGRFRDDGQIIFAGRIDHQLKVRGHRLEAGEVEAALEAHAGVRQAAVAVLGEDAEARLIAWVAAADGVAAAELRDWLAARLPAYMVPSRFEILDRLPLLPNGKVDRKRLPAPVSTTARGRAPETPVERALAAIWRQTLGVAEVGMSDDFFELGGQSLLMARLAARLRESQGVELPISKLFEIPTLEGQAAELTRLLDDEAAPEEPALEPVPRSAPLPLSSAQQRMCVAHRLAADTTALHITVAQRLRGPFDPGTLARALSETVRRHEILRTTFGEGDDDAAPTQRIAPPAPVSLPVLDLTALPADRRRGDADRAVAAEVSRPFDLAGGPLLRARLLRLEPAEWILNLTLHHAITDAESMPVLIEELTVLYGAFRRGRTSPLAELPIQYADYAVWERRRARGERWRRQLDYWRRQLAGAPTRLELGAQAGAGPEGAYCRFRLPVETSAALEQLGREARATPFMTVLAVFLALLYRRTGQTDQVVVTDVANRQRPELERLIGFFVNPIALRVRLAGSSGFRELLSRVRRTALDAYDHQDVPFPEALAAAGLGAAGLGAAGLDSEPTAGPPFNIYFTLDLEPALTGALRLADGTVVESLARSAPPALRDLTLSMFRHEGAFLGIWHYDVDRFTPSAIDRFSREFRALAAAVVRAPEHPLDELELETGEDAAARQVAQERRRARALNKLKQVQPKAVALGSDMKGNP